MLFLKNRIFLSKNMLIYDRRSEVFILSSVQEPIEAFFPYGKRMVVKKGGSIYNSNRADDNRYAFFLDSGCCALSSLTKEGDERTYLYFREKRTIGFVQLTPVLHERHSEPSSPFLITATTDCVLYRVSQEMFMYLLQNNAEFGNYMLRVLSENYLDLLHRYHEAQDECATVRLCRLLLEYAEEINGQLVMPSYFTHVEFSHYLGTHVVTVSRIMAQLKQRGYIEKMGHKIILCAPKELRQLVETGMNFDF